MRVILEVRDGPLKGRRLWLSEGDSLRVGRTDKADFALPQDVRMSRLHFAVAVDAGTCRLRDLDSKNGTFLEGQRIAEAELADGEQIRAGETKFVVRIEREPEEGTASVSNLTAETHFDERASARRLGQWEDWGACGNDSDMSERAGTVPSGLFPVRGLLLAEPAVSADAERIVQRIVLPGQTPERTPILAVLVKRTYDIVPGRRCVRAEQDRELTVGDVHYGDPSSTAVEFESDGVPYKIATDIVLNGRAYAPGGVPARSLTAALRVGPVAKELLVIGDRVSRFRPNAVPAFTEPLPFEKLELRYERAYGGVDVQSHRDGPCAYPRNHLGRGFVVRNIPLAVDHLPLPNIEDPAQPLVPEGLCLGHFREWERQPLPAGFGWYSKYWYPRPMYACGLPADWCVEQALLAIYRQTTAWEQCGWHASTAPSAVDFRCFNGSAPGLAVPYLRGDEVVHTRHLTPAGELQFLLPDDRPQIGVDLGGLHEPEGVLHTVMIRLEDRQVDLVWRGAVPYAGPASLPGLKPLEVHIQ